MKLTADLIGGILKPITELVDNFHTSVEEKQQLKNEIQKSLISLTQAAFDYEKSVFEAQSAVIIAEAQGSSPAQRNWRPHLMYLFMAVIATWTLMGVARVFIDFPEVVFPVMPSQVWYTLQLGLGGYIGGRSAEKIAKTMSLNPGMLKLPGEDRRSIRAYRKMLKQAKTPEERSQIIAMMEGRAETG